ncbi:MAG: ABC transporter substrate-binding protein [Acetobacteraceae bacterium]
MTAFNTTRRALLGSVAGLAAGAPFARAQTAPTPVQVGLLVPISGIYAQFGILMREGAEQAVKDINAAGGVKSLGGAPIDLRIFDAGDTTEKAKNAAQRMVADNPGLVAASGAYLSSFTLSASEVTERAELPMLTLSYSDLITSRGFRYIFQTSAKADAMANESLPVIMKLAQDATGKKLETIGIITDNTASSLSFVKPIRADGPTKFGLKIVMDETLTPPLSDATQLIQKVRSTRPDLLIMAITVISDAKLLIEKMNEFGLGRGRVPTVGSGIAMAQKELLENLSPAQLEGFITIVGNWDAKGQDSVIAAFKKTTGEPWIGQNGIATYGDMWVIKEALEEAKRPDRHAVADALRAMDLTTGAALYYPGHRVKFDKTGLRETAGPVVVQWQNSVPVTVYPEDSATAKLFWLKR